MTVSGYDRERAAAYAAKWAFKRNPRYLNFDGMGGDCTSFVSQCLFAGSGIMNYQKDTGWYDNSAVDRAAGWSGVPYLYQFLTSNRSVGPFASPIDPRDAEVGDVLQLGNADGTWYHSLFVSGVSGGLLVTTHTYDAHLRPLSSYVYQRIRGLHIEGVRRW